MTRQFISRGGALLSLLVLLTAACAEKESPTDLAPRNLSVPANYANPQLAAAAA